MANLSASELAELQEIFSLIDRDHSGGLCVEEFAALGKSVKVNWTDKDMRTLVDFMDSDGSGFVEFKELVNVFATDLDPIGQGAITAEHVWQSLAGGFPGKRLIKVTELENVLINFLRLDPLHVREVLSSFKCLFVFPKNCEQQNSWSDAYFNFGEFVDCMQQ